MRREALLAALPTAGRRSRASAATTCSGTWRRSARCASARPTAREQLFVLLDEWVRAPRRLERDEALGELALRFFRSHGPATVKDLVRWAGITVRDARAGLAVARPAPGPHRGRRRRVPPGPRDARPARGLP